MSQWRTWSQKLHQKAEVLTFFYNTRTEGYKYKSRPCYSYLNKVTHLISQSVCGVNVFLLYCIFGIKISFPPRFLALVPDSVKKELLQRIRAFLAQHATLWMGVTIDFSSSDHRFKIEIVPMFIVDNNEVFIFILCFYFDFCFVLQRFGMNKVLLILVIGNLVSFTSTHT